MNWIARVALVALTAFVASTADVAAPARGTPVSTHYCWIDKKTGHAVPTYPEGTIANPINPDRRIKAAAPAKSGSPPTPRQVFIRGSNGIWTDTVTGKPVTTYPLGTTADPLDPNHRTRPPLPGVRSLPAMPQQDFIYVLCPLHPVAPNAGRK